MKNSFKHHEWNIVEEGFDAGFSKVSENCFTLGNGWMSQRGIFEEQYSGPASEGCHLAGIFESRTLEGPAKSGLPGSVSEFVPAPNWVGIGIQVDGEVLDLATCKIKGFRRVLNMRQGTLERSFTAKLVSGKEIKVKSTRFCSLNNKEVGVIRYSVKPLNFEGTVTVRPFIDGDVADPATGEVAWSAIEQLAKKRSGYIVTETRRSQLRVAVGMKFSVFKNKQKADLTTTQQIEDQYISCAAQLRCKTGDELVVYKYAGLVSSLHDEKSKLLDRCRKVVRKAFKTGYDKLLKAHTQAWEKRWEEADIVIEGDVAAQQGARFNLFQLLQNSASLENRPDKTAMAPNMTSTWETELFYLPFCLSVYPTEIVRNLLIFRCNSLPKAIEFAARMGFDKGAALFPMATVNGEECHADWENTFEAIHRNGAIAFSIYDYVRYTGDEQFLVTNGLEVLIAIARFWAQRVHWSQPKKQYVIHGVTGPNQFENNVNNNWYTNYLAVWCLRYTLEALQHVGRTAPEQLDQLLQRLDLDRNSETAHWTHIAEKMHLPRDLQLGVFLQHEGFADKELRSADTLAPGDRPLLRNWTWDRILRSCFIQQPDVLLGFYLFEEHFSEEQLRRNFDFYEPMTVHENSLSYAVHAILAAKLGRHTEATEMYQRIARLDLDSEPGDTAGDLHILGMAGAWLALVNGIGGLRTTPDLLSLDPFLPEGWSSFSFKIRWKGYRLQVKIAPEGVTVFNQTNQTLQLRVKGQLLELAPQQEATV